MVVGNIMKREMPTVMTGVRLKQKIGDLLNERRSKIPH